MFGEYCISPLETDYSFLSVYLSFFPHWIIKRKYFLARIGRDQIVRFCKVAGKWQEKGRKVAGKWQEKGRKVAGKWPENGLGPATILPGTSLGPATILPGTSLGPATMLKLAKFLW